MLDLSIVLSKLLSPIIKIGIKYPLSILGNFLFHSVMVNIYKLYFTIKKKILEQQPKDVSKKWISIINNRFSVHIAIAVIAILTIITNISTSHAESYIEKAFPKTSEWTFCGTYGPEIKALDYTLYHHDAPTGEFYTVTAHSG